MFGVCISETIDIEFGIYIDESGIEDNATRENGWSIKGARCFGEKVFRHTKRISMISGLNNNTIIAPLVFDGTTNKQVFETYVEQVLIPELKPNQIVIMDNINFHKTHKVKELIESANC